MTTFLSGVSFQERRFRAEYDQLRIKFIADYHSMIKHPINENIELIDAADKIHPYSIVCVNVINRLNPYNNNGNSREKLDTDSKFKLLNIARRAEIMQYSNYECDTRIKQLMVEATKLETPWRRDAIIKLLDKYKDVPTSDESVKSVKASLFEAAYIRDIHFDNLYYKFQIAKRTIRILNLVLISLLSIILVSSAVHEYVLKKSFLLGSFSDLWLVVLFGLLGAAFSTLLNLYKGSRLQNSIIKQMDALNLTFARLIIGASAGLIVFIILNSDLIIIKGFNDIDTSNTDSLKPLKVSTLALVFVGGFTERLVLNFVDRLSAQQDDKETRPTIQKKKE